MHVSPSIYEVLATILSVEISSPEDSIAAPENHGFVCRMAERLPFLNNVMQVLHTRAGDEDELVSPQKSCDFLYHFFFFRKFTIFILDVGYYTISIALLSIIFSNPPRKG